MGAEIGKGSFANVYKGVALATKTPVAIKKISKSKLKTKKVVENLEIEIEILKTVTHPHVVLLIGHITLAKNIYIIMEYCLLGDLSYFIRKRQQLVKTHPLVSQLLEKYPSPPNSNGLNRVLIIHFLQQLASAIEFLRSKNLVHRDLKPQNLLLCYPCHTKEQFQEGHYAGISELPILKIADFGFARFLPNLTMAETLCGLPLYMAPEILGYEKYNAKADLWSVGAVLYEMSVGKPPFKASNVVELLKRIKEARDHIEFPAALDIDPDIKRVICGLLKCKAVERMSFNEFFNDKLVLYDLNEEGSESLDHSSIDESLFISEYLPQRGPTLLKQQLQEAPPINQPRKKPSSKEINQESQIKPLQTQLKHQEQEGNLENQVKQEESRDKVLARPPLKEAISLQKLLNETELLNEKDYVVVEKKTVEVNALADEVAALNLTKNTEVGRQERRHRGSSLSQKRPSFSDRRFLILLSPSNALSKALGIALTKLWGVNTYIKEFPGHMTPEPPAPHSFSPLSQTALITTPTSSPGFERDNEHLATLVTSLERLLAESHAVHLFATVKYQQLVPCPPSSYSSAIDDSDDEEYTPERPLNLTPVAVKSLAEEGLALYIKTLSLLAKAMNMTSEWWYLAENGSVIRANFNDAMAGLDPELTSKLNNCVQWIRELFNSSLARADLIRMQLSDANEKLGIESDGSLNSDVIAEKLIFDRALEISRDAAVNELVGEDLQGCEVEYYTSIWMLEAILEGGEGGDLSLDKEDRAMVQKFIDSITNRLSVLRKKLDSGGLVAIERP